MPQGVAVTGMGIISAIGLDAPTNLRALQQGIAGIGRISRVQTKLADRIMVGEIAPSDSELAGLADRVPQGTHTRTSLLACVAVDEALRSAGLIPADMGDAGLVTATTVGGMNATEQLFYKHLESDEHWGLIGSHHAGHSGQLIADHIGVSSGLVTTISTACSSASNAIMLGARLIRAGRLDRAVVGGSDCLSKFTLNGFNSLMLCSPEPCRPFDEHRNGLNLGEAAAYLVLESEAEVQRRKAEPLAYVVGYANANDAHHQTASSEYGDGATAAMQQALQVARIDPAAIDHINAHGTATPNNDLSEGRACVRVFGDIVPPFTSTKGFTGHTLAAAGAVEAVYSILSLQHQTIFPTLNFNTGMKEFDLRPVTEVRAHRMQRILSNSLGFGGNCSSIILAKT